MYYSDWGGESNGIFVFGVLRICVDDRFDIDSSNCMDGEENVEERRLPLIGDDAGDNGIVDDVVEGFFVNGKKDRKL